MSEWPSQHEITDPAAVALLADLRALTYLTPFLAGPHTLSTAAAVLGRSTSTLAYWIPKFRAVGLLVELGAEQRGGMAMPRYRAPADQLVVPFRALPFDRRVALLDGGRMRVLRRFLDGLDEAIERDDAFRLGFSSPGPPSFEIGMVEADRRPDERPYTDGWLAMMLSDADARDLAQEMGNLIERFQQRSAEGGGARRRHIVHVGVAPEPRIRWRSAADDFGPEARR